MRAIVGFSARPLEGNQRNCRELGLRGFGSSVGWKTTVKILVLTPTFLPAVGGAEVGLYEIYQRLGMRHQVRLLTPFLRGHTREMEHRSFSFEVFRFDDYVNFCKLKGHRALKGLIPPFSLTFVEQARQQVDQFSPDVVNVHYGVPTGLAALWIQKKRGVPVVVSLVGRDVPGYRLPWAWKYYVRWILGGVSSVVYISPYCHRALFGHDEVGGKHHVIPYGVNLSRFSQPNDPSELRADLGIKPDEPVLFSLQRLAKLKRVDIVIRSMEWILKEVPSAVLVIGGSGTERKALEELAGRIAPERILFRGFIPDDQVPLYFALADLFVFHSLYETFGVVLVEALASGTPIVSVRCGAIPDLVKNDSEGIIVEPESPIEMANAVVRLLRQRGRREEMSRNCWKKALAYDWDEIATQYEEVLASAVSYSDSSDMSRRSGKQWTRG